MHDVPVFLKVPLAVAGFQARVTVQREHQEASFKAMLAGGERFEAGRAAIKTWPEERFFDIGRDPSIREALAQRDAQPRGRAVRFIRMMPSA